MKIKTCAAKIKAAGVHEGTDEGQFDAIVATYDLDSVGDRIIPGAFKETLDEWATSGNPIPVYWSHRMDDPAMNIGQVIEAAETDKGLAVKAQLDLDNPTAAQVYRLLKGRRVTQFSFAYDVEDGAFVEEKGEAPYYELRKLRLYEVGPTPIGANQATELLEVKGNRPLTIEVHNADEADRATITRAVKHAFATKGALPASSGPKQTSDAAWDGPKNEANLSNDDGAEVYKKAFAWVDPDGDPDKKSSYKFIHHEVSADGTVGAANTQACVTAIGILNGGRGGTSVPDDDRQGVYNHLAQHVKDAGEEPPALKAADEQGAKEGTEPDDFRELVALVDATKSDHLKAALTKLLARKEGRRNSATDADTIQSIHDAASTLGASCPAKDEGKATPELSATTEEPDGAKADEPAGKGTASNRLRTELDLMETEVSLYT